MSIRGAYPVSMPVETFRQILRLEKRLEKLNERLTKEVSRIRSEDWPEYVKVTENLRKEMET